MVFIPMPMPMETLRGSHEKTEMQVKELASALARHTGGEQKGLRVQGVGAWSQHLLACTAYDSCCPISHVYGQSTMPQNNHG